MPYEIWEKGDERVIIEQDDGAANPRKEDCYESVFVAKHRRYKLGDREPLNDIEWEDVQKDEGVAVLSVYLYDHSGISISATPYSCPWDSGCVGFIYEELKGRKREEVEEQLRSEIQLYDHYLRGNVYGYMRKKKNECPHCGDVKWEEIDSCWGFYGYPEDSGIYDDAFGEGGKEGWTEVKK
jgi:ribosomal protein S27AE